MTEATKTYCVVQHSNGEAGGYVVRTAHDGWLPAPYSNAERLAEYKRESAAQNYADKLNAAADAARDAKRYGPAVRPMQTYGAGGNEGGS